MSTQPSDNLSLSVVPDDDLFEAQLVKLQALLTPLREFLEAIGDEDGEDLDEKMSASCRRIAAVLQPDPDKREGFEGEPNWLLMAASHAETIAAHLETSWRLKRNGMKAHPAADMLIRLSNAEGRIGPGPEAAELMIQLPWMMKTALDCLLQDGDYEKNPAGGPAICSRMLAVFLSTLEKVDGLNWSPDAAQEATS